MTNEQIELLSKQLFKKEYLEQNHQIVSNFIADMKAHLKAGEFEEIRNEYNRIDSVLKNEETMAAGLMIISMAETNYNMQKRLNNGLGYETFLAEKKDMFATLKQYLIAYNSPRNYENVNTFKEEKINSSKDKMQKLSVALESEKNKPEPDQKQIKTYEMLIEVYQCQIEIIQSIGDFTQENSWAAFQKNYEKWVDIKIEELQQKLFKEYKENKQKVPKPTPTPIPKDNRKEIEKVEEMIEKLSKAKPLTEEEKVKLNKNIDEANKKIIELEKKIQKANGDLKTLYPELTEEQLSDIEAEGLKYGDQELDQQLMQYNIKPINKQLDELKNIVKEKNEQLNLKPENLKAYEKIRDAYNKMRDDISDELGNILKDHPEDDPNRLNNFVTQKLEAHENYHDLDSYENKDKMIKELKEDIITLAKEKSKELPAPIEEQNKGNLFLKCLAGAGGFAAGVGISAVAGAVPVLGATITIYAGARMVYQTGKLICNIATKINKGQEPKVITKIKEKVPEKIQKAAKILFDKPKNPYMKWFVNGASLGYLTDQVFDISGKIGNAISGPAGSNTVTPTPTQTGNATPVDPIGDTMSMTDVYSGKSIDLSSLEYGYSNSYADTPVHLMQELGKGAVYDKSNVVDGVEWLHFKSLDGDGYAWFPKDKIEALLTTTTRSR